MAYELEGQLLEVCNCNVLCPCWIGEDPDNGTCDAIVSYKIDKGMIDGVDVSGQSFTMLVHIPGNVLQGNWQVMVLLDESATEEQEEAILGVWTGQRGGPVADLAKLVGKVVGVERAPVSFDVREGEGTLKIGGIADAEMTPYKGPTGQTTTLNESVFTTIPGSPAWVSKASTYRRNSEKYGLRDIDLHGSNAIQGTFRFVA
jgi:hypothetical protein